MAAAEGPGPAAGPSAHRPAHRRGHPFPGPPMLCLAASRTPPVALFRSRAGRLSPGSPGDPLPLPAAAGERRRGRRCEAGRGVWDARQCECPMRRWRSPGAAGGAAGGGAGGRGRAGLRECGDGSAGVSVAAAPALPPPLRPPVRRRSRTPDPAPGGARGSVRKGWRGNERRSSGAHASPQYPAAPQRTAPGSVQGSGWPRVAGPAGGERSAAEPVCAGGMGVPRPEQPERGQQRRPRQHQVRSGARHRVRAPLACECLLSREGLGSTLGKGVL